MFKLNSSTCACIAQVGYYPLWQYGNPGLGGLPRPETIPYEGDGHQDYSNHHNEVSPYQLMPSALFQQQMQDREQQPAPHETESEFTSQVESYPLQCDISGVTDSVPSEETSFVDIDGPPENIDEETGSFWTEYQIFQTLGVKGEALTFSARLPL
ncbi:hypothetical protein MRX96_053295 [Rhipicephalus microplus]